MLKKITFLFFAMASFHLSFSQSLDSLKLNDADIPAGYSKSPELNCATVYACSFYEQMSLYESILGKVTRQEFQSFDKKNDQGSILYFEFETDFKGEGFIKGLLWGKNSKPTKAASDEYYVKGRILIIWSFRLQSEIREISKKKIIGR